jgi:hypothetical protein
MAIGDFLKTRVVLMGSLSVLMGLSLTEIKAQASPAVNYIGYTGKQWTKDYGVLAGQCDSVAFQDTSMNPPSAVLVDSDINHPIDTHCFGHTLELVPTGKSAQWNNPVTGTNFFLTPGKHSDKCRTFNGIKVANGESQPLKGVACSNSPGQWKIVK